jgi:hypothetical protein
MNVLLAAHTPLAVDLNAPGGHLNWSIFTISEANLVLIGSARSKGPKGPCGQDIRP